jgi:hypothetical protein
MNNLIDNFIKNNNLDENIKYILIDFVNQCFFNQLGITTYNNNDISKNYDQNYRIS